MPHPQERELVEKIARFLSTRGPEALTVHAPDGRAEVQIFEDLVDLRDEHAVPVVAFRVRADDASKIAAAKRLMLPKPRRQDLDIRFGPAAGSKVTLLAYRAPFPDAAAGARLCLDVLHEVRGMPADAWLWITDEPYANWPDPLPKPPVGPPA